MKPRPTDAVSTRRRKQAADTPAPEIKEAAPETAPPARQLLPAAPPAPAPSLDADALAELSQMDAGDFARLMSEVVGGRRARFRGGEEVSGRISAIGDKDLFIDLGDKSEAVLSIEEVRGPDGRPTVSAGQMISARVLSVRDGEVRLSRRLAGASARGQLEEAMNARVPVEGRVTGRNSGGYTVDIGGAKAFCPVSQIARQVGEDPDAWVGRTLTFRVQQVRGGEAIVSHRVVEEAELRERAEKLWAELKPGQERSGSVSSLQPYGAFVDLGGVEGLVHVSKISWEEIRSPGDALKVGDAVRVKVLEVDAARQRLSLSIRDADAPRPARGDGGGLGTFGDLFKAAKGRSRG